VHKKKAVKMQLY